MDFFDDLTDRRTHLIQLQKGSSVAELLIAPKELVDRLQQLTVRAGPERRKGRAQVTTQWWEQLAEAVSRCIAATQADSAHIEVRDVRDVQMGNGCGNAPM